MDSTRTIDGLTRKYLFIYLVIKRIRRILAGRASTKGIATSV